MSRIRTVKPEFFKHYGLFHLEETTKLPVRLASRGFGWKPTAPDDSNGGPKN